MLFSRPISIVEFENERLHIDYSILSVSVMEFLDLTENGNAVPRPRRIRDRVNPITFFDEEEFRHRFRLPKPVVLHLCHQLAPLLQYPSNANNCLPPILQVCGALRVLSAGAFQTVIADTIHVHQSTVSRILDRFISSLLRIRTSHIYFPENLNAIKRSFFDIGGFPGIIGAIDGTHIPIRKPHSHDNPEIFRNRKSSMSLNVQIVAGPNLEIYNCVARWPGSTHDSRVFSNSFLKDRFESGDLENRGYLLGDKGYPCLKYLLTPVRNAMAPSERRYNTSHCRTRCVVERSIGVLKKRFPCLTNKLNYSPSKCANITTVCAMLHNLAIRAGDPDFGADTGDDSDDEQFSGVESANGKAMRRAVIQSHFL